MYYSVLDGQDSRNYCLLRDGTVNMKRKERRCVFEAVPGRCHNVHLESAIDDGELS